VAVLIGDCVVANWILPSQPQLDEAVFFPAALAFAKAGFFPSVDFLRHYPAPQTPLAFYIAGRLLNFIPSLRLLRTFNASLLSFALLRLIRFARACREQHAWLAAALFVANPYFHLVATHFYTDALYVTLVVVLITRTQTNASPATLAALPLVRQFGLIFPVGVALHALRTNRMRPALWAAFALVPTAMLFALWGAPAPETEFAEIPRSVHRFYGIFFPYVATYHVAALGFYTAPALIWAPRTSRFWCGAAGASLAYVLAPTHPNFSAILTGSGITTLGMFHRLASSFGAGAEHVILCFFAGCGGGLVGEALRSRSELAAFLALFVAGSVFNFQAWDKYLLDVIPVVLFALFTGRATAIATSSR